MGVVVLVGAHVRHYTDDGVATVTAGLAIDFVVAYHLRAGYGFKTKYFVSLAALAAFWFLAKDCPFLGGLAAASAVGFWNWTPASYNTSERKALLWYDVIPITCLIFVAITEAMGIERTRDKLTAVTCK